MAEHNRLGIQGEQIAREFLQKQGYEILETNWRFGKKEIDIIARDGNTLVIVEVKTRTGDYFGLPWEAVSDRKIRFLVHAAEGYILKHNFNNETRFDVVSIVSKDGKFQIEHIKDAFNAPLS